MSYEKKKKELIIKYFRDLANTIEMLPSENIGFDLFTQETVGVNSVHEIKISLSPLAAEDFNERFQFKNVFYEKVPIQ